MEKPVAVVLKPDEETLARMRRFYDCPTLPEGPIDFRVKGEGFSLTVYKKNKKGEVTALFQGENAYDESLIWGKPEKKETRPSFKKPLPPRRTDEIGSDEVGTGDFFGPVIVAAAFVSKANYGQLKELGVTDSKALTDERILEIGPKILALADYSELCLMPEKYNEVFGQGLNMNAIKAKMHNRALLNVKARHPSSFVYVDQFAAEKTYYSYLKGEQEILRGITFATKGESKYLSVATASVLARYSFLKKMASLSEAYKMEFPFGAASHVDEFAKKFVKAYGRDERRKVAKCNFKNMERL